MGSFEGLMIRLYWGTKDFKKATPLMKATVGVQQVALNSSPTTTTSCSKYTPLWCNPKLLHLKGILDPNLWAHVGLNI